MRLSNFSGSRHVKIMLRLIKYSAWLVHVQIIKLLLLCLNHGTLIKYHGLNEKLSYEPQSFLSSILSDLSTIPNWRY